MVGGVPTVTEEGFVQQILTTGSLVQRLTCLDYINMIHTQAKLAPIRGLLWS